jgi:hypothetical protein
MRLLPYASIVCYRQRQGLLPTASGVATNVEHHFCVLMAEVLPAVRVVCYLRYSTLLPAVLEVATLGTLSCCNLFGDAAAGKVSFIVSAG